MIYHVLRKSVDTVRKIGHLLPSIKQSLQFRMREDRGSAIVEFVALAIPLFIPIFIYLNQFASLSGNEEIVRVLAREGLRAYVASELIRPMFGPSGVSIGQIRP